MSNIAFPLESWFDLTKKISKIDVEIAESQIMLYAYKEGDSVNSKEMKVTCRELRKSVRLHNSKFSLNERFSDE